MAAVTSTMSDLLRKDVAFLWMHKHEEALITLKGLISKVPVLAHSDKGKPIVLQCDSSKDGWVFFIAKWSSCNVRFKKFN